jgi:membrane associated rhomboid family serine protease
MGIYDRDYYRDDDARPLGIGTWSITTWLLVLNLAVFFFDAISAGRQSRPRNMEEYRELIERRRDQGPLAGMSPLKRWGHFSMETAIESGQVWRFITFQFLHADIMHLAGNLISLFLFGSVVEAHFGKRRFIAFYLLCGIAGALTYLLMAWTNVLQFPDWAPMVGASAGIFGILVAGAIITPHREVWSFFTFIPIPMTMRTMAIVLMVIAGFTVFRQGPNAGGQAAHLGGGVLGLLLMFNQHWLHLFEPSRPTAARRGRKKAAFKDWSKEWDR